MGILGVNSSTCESEPSSQGVPMEVAWRYSQDLGSPNSDLLDWLLEGVWRTKLLKQRALFGAGWVFLAGCEDRIISFYLFWWSGGTSSDPAFGAPQEAPDLLSQLTTPEFSVSWDYFPWTFHQFQLLDSLDYDQSAAGLLWVVWCWIWEFPLWVQLCSWPPFSVCGRISGNSAVVWYLME